MQNKRTTSTKLLSALLAGAFCATPLVVTTAQAAPNHSQRQPNNQKKRLQTFTGIVTEVERNSFDIRVGNKTYEVHPSGKLPQQLSKNDQVRVYGQVDDDDIRNANVTITRDNDKGNNGNHWGHGNQGNRYQTFTGIVTDVDRRSFDVRVGNKEYEVYPSGNMPQQLSKNDQVRVYGQVDDDDIRNANVTIIRDNDKGNNGNHWGGNQGKRYQTFTGIVTDVDRRSFDIRVGNKEYEVYPSGNMPQQLSKNDQVRVYGQVDDDDIRNANVTIIRDNDKGNNGHHWGGNQGNRYQTFTGVVTDVDRRSFDIRVGNKEYEVYPSGNMPQQLSKNDQVRVYGQVDDDDIRNANVTIIRDNDKGKNDNNPWGENKYQTLTGTVEKKVDNNSFDFKVSNKTYRVRLSGNAPSSLSKNDVVRVYGQVYGSNDIRNANVVVVQNR